MILRLFNVERVAETEAEIAKLKAAGYEEVAPKKAAKKSADKKEEKENGVDK